ncbi:unnamed protein product [Phytomonas sp. EM1]|nr:unnamed protein product [Phytomonas sp. EM1]|eukprot:CCW62641.1 unnamed protein product [Phytomonas sp. isolate EM1]
MPNPVPMASALEVAHCIRCLAADIVQGANSGHPGTPMGMAPVATVLWTEVMKYLGSDPDWADRDRFVLSNGHGCALLYSLLHMSGYALSLEELKRFRQLGSLTPGHPERGLTPGVEVTTGPLGQGVANAVGLAIAEANLAATFNRPGLDIVNHWTYVFCGDGCLMEGACMEALSLAGHLCLEKLVVVYDSNQITIDGSTKLTFTENVRLKQEALNFHVIKVEDADNDFEALRNAFIEAKTVQGKPKFILINTTIGYGSKAQGTAKVHGAPLGDEDIAVLKTKFGRDPNKKYHIDDAVYEVFRKHMRQCEQAHREWNEKMEKYSKRYPNEAAAFKAQLKGELPTGWEEKLPLNDKPVATRKASENCLAALLPVVPSIIGGSADLTPSNLTRPSSAGMTDFTASTPEGRYIRFGVREHAMLAILNGIDAHGGLLPYTGTFLTFFGYALGAVRLAALGHHHVIYVATHDSIGLGEDGPTHQPVEVVAMMRAIPNLLVFRPADQTETSGAWAAAIRTPRRPSMLCLSRQNTTPQAASSIAGVAKGAYVVREVDDPQLLIISSGAEVGIAMEAATLLSGLRVRVVSMPCQELFDEQPLEYRDSIIPRGIPVVSVEPYVSFGWDKYSHVHVGMSGFGASAPSEKLFKHFDLTPERVAEVGRKLIERFPSGTAPLKACRL